MMKPFHSMSTRYTPTTRNSNMPTTTSLSFALPQGKSMQEYKAADECRLILEKFCEAIES